MTAGKIPHSKSLTGTSQLPTYDVSTLMEGGQQAWIVHEGQIYTLRITRAGKLILTK